MKALIKAGAIPLAVTNVSELCMWMESYNKVYGKTNNPYHNGRIPGGSSGGEASNLAAAGSPFGIGSDVGGSIRMPAFFNGIFGHKPSTGLVSNKGQIPGATGIIDTFLSTGPMSRYAADLLPMFKVMLKPSSLNLNLKLDEPINLRKIKLYYMKDDGGNPIVSPVNDELIDIQTKVVRKWKECHQGHPEAILLLRARPPEEDEELGPCGRHRPDHAQPVQGEDHPMENYDTSLQNDDGERRTRKRAKD